MDGERKGNTVPTKDTRTHADRAEDKQRLAQRQKLAYKLMKQLADNLQMDFDEYVEYLENRLKETTAAKV